MAIVFPSSPTVGQVFTSGSRSWIWTGSTWDSPSAVTAALSGLTMIVNQTITNSAGYAVDNVFTSLYDNYRVVLKVDSMSASNVVGINMSYRKAGATITAANYRYGSYYISIDGGGAGIFTRSNGAGPMYLGAAGVPSTPSVFSIDVFSPNIATTTTQYTMQAMTHYNGTAPSNSSNVPMWGSGSYTANDNLDGLIITPSAGNFSGNIKIYGYRN
jgi:hypothetical protein